MNARKPKFAHDLEKGYAHQAAASKLTHAQVLGRPWASESARGSGLREKPSGRAPATNAPPVAWYRPRNSRPQALLARVLAQPECPGGSRVLTIVALQNFFTPEARKLTQF